MTLRQKLLKAVYPAFMWLGKDAAKKKNRSAGKKLTPPVSFYSLEATRIDGSSFDFEQLKGRKVLLVNTASYCGYTGQFDELEKLYRTCKDRLLVIGFPSNDFKEQEKGSNEEIEQFCRLNYGVTFPLMQKQPVKKTPEQQPVFQWLTHAEMNGWNNQQPAWNFSKYLIDENGRLTNCFPPGLSPLDKEIISAIEEKE